MTDASFWDKIAPKYAKNPIANPTAYEQSQARVRSYLNRDDNVLELGCGTGSTALLLKDQVARYVASDISPGMISIARGKEDADKVDFRVAGPEAEAYEDDSFNVILAFNLLHLLPDLEGRFRISIPCCQRAATSSRKPRPWARNGTSARSSPSCVCSARPPSSVS